MVKCCNPTKLFDRMHENPKFQKLIFGEMLRPD